MLPRARVADEKASITARLELRPWDCCVLARMGSSFSSGTLDSSVAGQPALQSRVTSSVGSVGKSKSSHDTVCLLIENYDQIAISCVGMADVNILVWLPAQQSRSYNKGIKDEIQSQCLHFFS